MKRDIASIEILAQYRWVAERGLDALITWATRLSRRQAWGVTALAVVFTALASHLIGPQLWFGPLYLLIICLPAWAIGRRAGILVGFACMAIMVAVHGMNIYPVGYLAVAWNMAMRMLAVTIIVLLVGGFRRLYDREWQRARSDELTGALSRQAFYEQAAADRNRPEWGALAYVDLDGFKQINDRHGHAAGDDVLRAFSAAVQNVIRATDIFARVGGDEFLLFLPVEDEADGRRIAGQLQARMNDVLDLMPYPVRCSIGVLVLKPGAKGVTHGDVAQADRLMYEAKQAGGAALRIATGGRSEAVQVLARACG